MAYSNYGAFVFKNGERREDKEDCKLFDDSKIESWADMCHGVLGDKSIRVKCYKQYMPEIYERKSSGEVVEIPSCDKNDSDYDEFNFDVEFEYKGYKFKFTSGEPCEAIMIEPTGDEWKCNYDYNYGSCYYTL